MPETVSVFLFADRQKVVETVTPPQVLEVTMQNSDKHQMHD